MRKIIISLLGALAATVSMAAEVSPALFSLNAQLTGEPGINTGNLDTPITFSDDATFDNGFARGQAVAVVNQTGGFRPQIDIQLAANVNADTAFSFASTQATASSSIVYSMRINGPTDRLVPVQISVLADINGQATESASGLTTASGSGSISIFGVDSWSIESRWNVLCPPFGTCVQDGPSDIGVTQTYDLIPGNEYTVFMSGSASSRAGRSNQLDPLAPASNVQVIVDPLFEFTNPGDAAIYSFEFSPNIIPIPPAVWLFASALAGMGLFRGRRA